MYEVRMGDAFTVRFTAERSDGTPINLTGVKIWASLGRNRTDTPLIVKKNTAGGGSDAQVEIEDAVNGIFLAHFASADTNTLSAKTRYFGDARITLATGEVYTVGEFEIYTIDPYTGIPA